MSLRALNRNDSKLVIYGAGGLASPAGGSVQTTPNHHTLKLESHEVGVRGATPTLQVSNPTPTHRGQGTTPSHTISHPHRGSISDVEHKSVSALLKSHSHSNQATPTSGSIRNSMDHTSSVVDGERRRSRVREVSSPTRGMVAGEREEQWFSSVPQGSFTTPTSVPQGSLTRPKKLNNYEPPPKREWYHDDAQSPLEERAFNKLGNDDHFYRASSTTGVETLPRGSGHTYKRHDSVDHVQNYRHSSSTENVVRERSTGHMRRFHHSQSVDQIGGENRHSSPSKHPYHHQTHHHNNHQHHRDHHRHPRERDGELNSSPSHHTRSSRSNSDLHVQKRKSSSLSRDTPPRLQEEEEPMGQSASHYSERHHLARPANRGHYRLSLPESSYYDNNNRIGRQSNARRSRKGVTNHSLTSTTSLSQPNDFGLGVSLLSPLSPQPVFLLAHYSTHGPR